MSGHVLALIGAQWGSEGKGVIAGQLARHFDAAVRVGGPNAGHSLYYQRRLFKMRQVPCAWVNPETELHLGAGAVIKPELLLEELGELPGYREIIVDPMAVVVQDEDEQREANSIKRTIGSTAEGVGEARIARMRRGTVTLAGDIGWKTGAGVRVESVAPRLWTYLDEGRNIMLEGTQGSGLSLLHGAYPYVTSADTNAAQLAADAGLAPGDVAHVQLVARTMPIRVANPEGGTSGPMGEEVDWQELIDAGVVPAAEQTTVTKRTRRIARWSWEVMDRAVKLNKPCGIWLTFGDYLAPEARGAISLSIKSLGVHSKLELLIRGIQTRYSIPILGIGTGPVVEAGEVVDWSVARWNSRCSHWNVW